MPLVRPGPGTSRQATGTGQQDPATPALGGKPTPLSRPVGGASSSPRLPPRSHSPLAVLLGLPPVTVHRR